MCTKLAFFGKYSPAKHHKEKAAALATELRTLPTFLHPVNSRDVVTPAMFWTCGKKHGEAMEARSTNSVVGGYNL